MTCRRRVTSRLLTAGSVLVLALCLGLPVAQPAGASTGASTGGSAGRWRVVTRIGPPDGVTYPNFLAVSGPDDAWSWWNGCAPCSGGGSHNYSLLEHWDGARWRAMKTPAVAQGIVGLAASSASNVWIFAVRGATPKHKVAYHMAIWDGRSWRVQAIPAWVIGFSRAGFYFVNPVVFGPGNVWAFSIGRYAAHFNGRNWARIKMPLPASTVSAVSASDIWAISYRPAGGQALMHWDGRSWRLLPIPKPARIPPKSTEYVGGLTAAGPDSVWLTRDIQTGSQGARSLYLMHWDGRSWHRIGFRFPTSFAGEAAQDGHGGLWLAANGVAPGYHWYFDHLLAGGTWTRQAMPARGQVGLAQNGSPMQLIPGTRSVWAVGSLFPPNNKYVIGAIFKYGP